MLDVVVGFPLVGRQLLATILQTEHPQSVIEALLVDSVLALYLAVVAGCSDTDAVVTYPVFLQLQFKQTLFVWIVGDQRLGELRAIVRLDFMDWEGTVLDRLYPKICVNSNEAVQNAKRLKESGQRSHPMSA